MVPLEGIAFSYGLAGFRAMGSPFTTSSPALYSTMPNCLAIALVRC